MLPQASPALRPSAVQVAYLGLSLDTAACGQNSENTELKQQAESTAGGAQGTSEFMVCIWKNESQQRLTSQTFVCKDWKHGCKTLWATKSRNRIHIMEMSST